ncbi:hypothetical protein ASE85_02460 [Sphingobium sp. Leaf26]|uniref:hypothetical protein n=1 Tax=Sphingobium sp. Leaf26 TaxID=1735693 RepID=UPI0006F97A32|nr:hypothetical protein [Sphingobium sp. Leaf26]KQN09817.1 hypothetical protein ASE85_02460 [Sphingobium sp. Leaf26]
MSELKTYRARERGYVDDRMVEEGETFTTAKPKGKWMAELDDKGNEIPDPEPEPPVDVTSEAVAAAQLEIRERAQAVVDKMRTDFDDSLKAEKARADNAEKLLSDAKAESEKLLTEADAAIDKATQRAEAAEKEVEALKAEIAKLKTAPTAKAK